jgi:hypothetical protein
MRKLMSEAVNDLINNWNLLNRIQFMCFYTTSSNTGLISGACVLLEKKLGRNLLKFACRHHIFKIVVGKIVVNLIDPSNGPDIAMFRKLSNSWTNINQEAFENGLMILLLSPKLYVIKSEMVKFIFNQLTECQPRDYRELLQLSLYYVG